MNFLISFFDIIVIILFLLVGVITYVIVKIIKCFNHDIKILYKYSESKFSDIANKFNDKNRDIINLIEKKLGCLSSNIQSINSKIKLFELFEKKTNDILEKNKIQQKQKNINLDENYKLLEKKFYEQNDLINNMQKNIITLTDKLSDLKKQNEEKKILLIKNQSIEKIIDFSLIFHSGEKERLIYEINKLLDKEYEYFETINKITYNFSINNPNMLIPLPDGFNSIYLDMDGITKIKLNTLHLLSYNYLNTNKFIETVLIKYFIDKIDVNTFSYYNINSQSCDSMLLYKFDIKTDIPFISPDLLEFIILETQCLRGIYYVFIARQLCLERFISTFQTSNI